MTAADIFQWVLAEKIRLLFRQMPVVLAANIVNAGLVAFALWAVADRLSLTLWGAAVTMVALLRLIGWARFRAVAPTDADTRPWALGYVIGSAVSGLLWGSAAVLFIEPGHLLPALLITFVIAGMNAGAVAGLSSHLPAFAAFMLPSVLPLAGALLIQPDRIFQAMGAMVTLFTIALAVIACNLHASLTDALRLRLEKQLLLEDVERRVQERTEDLRAANERLRHEASERERAQEQERRLTAEIARQERQLDLILSTTSDPVFLFCCSGPLLYASASVARDLGIHPAAGATWSQLGLPPDEASAMERLHSAAMTSRQGVTGMIAHTLPQGSRTYEYKFNPVIEPDGRVSAVIATSRDMTEHLASEEALKRARAEAEHANKAKSRFLASASHDLRQPFQALQLFHHLLSARLTEPETRRIADKMAEAIAAGNNLLNSLLDVSTLEAGVLVPKVTTVPIQSLLDRLQREFEPQAAAQGLALKTIGCRTIVETDPLLLERILRNLIANAVRHAHHGRILVGCRHRGASLVIAVCDTGPGIPADQIRMIFEDFYQIGNPERSHNQGLGLGLSIVDRMARLLGHTVQVTSRPGQGSIFSVTVPVTGPLARPPPVSAAGPAILITARPRSSPILVIEDNPLQLAGMEMSLTDWGYAVVTAADADSALILLRSLPEPPVLILTDFRLPGESNGVEAIRRLCAAAGRSIPSLIITGDTDPVRLREAKAAGCTLLHKPIDPQALRTILEKSIAAMEPS